MKKKENKKKGFINKAKNPPLSKRSYIIIKNFFIIFITLILYNIKLKTNKKNSFKNNKTI